MKKYNLILGSIISTVLAVGILPTRIYQGQGNDPFNLVGSEIMIWVMCLTSWWVTYHIQLLAGLSKWQRIVLPLILCVVLSNLFYYTVNPFFEDYPLSPMLKSPVGVALLRLSLRGFLMGLIVVPIAFLFENERQQNRGELDSQKQRVQVSEEQKQLLESLVAERTRTLENTLSLLRKSESELDNQVYVLSRLVASVAHDVVSPLKYMIIATEQINRFLQSGRQKKAVKYNQELLKSLIGISGLMSNLLEFTKTQVRRESIVLTDLDLSILINDKIQLFEGILNSNKNKLFLQIDPGLTIRTNYNLVAIVLHNLIDNAANYTYAGIISITMKDIDTGKKLTIENTINTDSLSSLVDPNHKVFLEQLSGDYPPQSDGIGLLLVRNISALLNIDFSFEVKHGTVRAQLIFNKNADMHSSNTR